MQFQLKMVTLGQVNQSDLEVLILGQNCPLGKL